MVSRARVPPWRWPASLAVVAAIALVSLMWGRGEEPVSSIAPLPAPVGAPGVLVSRSGSKTWGNTALPEENGAPSARELVPEPVVAVRPSAGRAARPGTERAYYQSLVAESREDFDAFAEQVDQALSGQSPNALRVAALRAWFDQARDRGLKPFVDVLNDPRDQLALREFALRFLGARAKRHVEARDVLRGYLETRPQEPRWRAEALFAVLRWGEDSELRNCHDLLRLESDPGVLKRAVQALRASDAPAATSLLEVVRAWLNEA